MFDLRWICTKMLKATELKPGTQLAINAAGAASRLHELSAITHIFFKMYIFHFVEETSWDSAPPQTDISALRTGQCTALLSK